MRLDYFLVHQKALLLLLMVWLEVGGQAHAASVGRVTPDEVAMLPEYCHHISAREKERASLIQYWESKLGGTFNHIHHYCYGLNLLNRSQRIMTVRSDFRRSSLSQAVKEFTYVIDRAPEDFVLLPEILYKRGSTLLQLGESKLAEQDLKRTIQIYPRYDFAYVKLGEIYRDRGELTTARQTVSDGLRNSPDSKVLLALREKLGNKVLPNGARDSVKNTSDLIPGRVQAETTTERQD